VKNGIVFHLGLLLKDGSYKDILLRAENFSIKQSDGKKLDLEQFLKLGDAYWEDFANQGKK